MHSFNEHIKLHVYLMKADKKEALFTEKLYLPRFQGSGVVHAGSLSHFPGLLGPLNSTEPSLLVTPVLFLVYQVKISAVKKACSSKI